MPKNYEESSHRQLSPREKRKIFICKCVLGIIMACALIPLVTDENSTLSSDLLDINGLLSAFFGYLNLLNIKSELIELFEPPYPFTGFEFIIIAFPCSIISLFIY